MKNATVWLWLCGLLAGLPFVTLVLLVRERMVQPAWQRVGIQRGER
jgi:hypothetical protein